MARFKVTFEDRKGRKTAMVIEDINASGAAETASFFSNANGKVVKTEPIK